MSQLDSN